MRLSRAQVDALSDAAGLAWSVPPRLLAALSWHESGWNTEPAHGLRWIDELGPMQIRPGTARMLGYRGDLRALEQDPAISFDLAAKYLSSLHARHGSWGQALSAYNAGHPIRSNLQTYVRPILERAGMVQPQEKSSLVPLLAAGALALVLLS